MVVVPPLLPTQGHTVLIHPFPDRLGYGLHLRERHTTADYKIIGLHHHLAHAQNLYIVGLLVVHRLGYGYGHLFAREFAQTTASLFGEVFPTMIVISKVWSLKGSISTSACKNCASSATRSASAWEFTLISETG